MLSDYCICDSSVFLSIFLGKELLLLTAPCNGTNQR